MMKWMLAAGAAALAITAPSAAQQGGGKGGQKGHAAHTQKADRGGGGHKRAQKSHGGGDHAKQVRIAQKDDRGKGRDGKEVRGNDRGRTVRADNDDRGRGRARGNDKDVRVVRADHDRDVVRLARFDDDVDLRFAPRWDGNGLRSGFLNGCPPGLAKKGNGCLPPGQAKKLVGTALSPAIMSNALAGPYRLWYRDDDDFIYRWDDDYIYRVRRDGGLIDALFPYANRDFYYYPVGAPYPDYYNYYNVPYQYRSFYPDGGDYLYRYGDGAIYMVDPQTRAIQGIAALLTGAPLTVGQPLPPNYGVYNVPLAYRSSYYDTPDALYRYNDGYIYRVDPSTMLITAVIDALV